MRTPRCVAAVLPVLLLAAPGAGAIGPEDALIGTWQGAGGRGGYKEYVMETIVRKSGGAYAQTVHVTSCVQMDGDSGWRLTVAPYAHIAEMKRGTPSHGVEVNWGVAEWKVIRQNAGGILWLSLATDNAPLMPELAYPPRTASHRAYQWKIARGTRTQGTECLKRFHIIAYPSQTEPAASGPPDPDEPFIGMWTGEMDLDVRAGGTTKQHISVAIDGFREGNATARRSRWDGIEFTEATERPPRTGGSR